MNEVSVICRVVGAVALTMVLPLASCASTEAPGSRAGCEKVRDHLATLQIAQAQQYGASLTPETADAHRAAMVATLGDAYLDDCAERGPAWIDCASRAASATDVDACGAGAP